MCGAGGSWGLGAGGRSHACMSRGPAGRAAGKAAGSDTLVPSPHACRPSLPTLWSASTPPHHCSDDSLRGLRVWRRILRVLQGAEERRVEIQAAIDADAPLNMGEADTLVVAQVLKVRATHSGPNQLDTS